MAAQTLYLSKREFIVIVVLLIVLFSIPLLVPMVYKTSQATSIWSSYYLGGAMIGRGLGSQLYDAAQQTNLWNSLESRGQEILPYIAPPYLAVLLSVLSALPYTESSFLWALLNFVIAILILYHINREAINYPDVSLFWIDLGMILFVPFLTVIVVQQTSFILVLAVLMSWKSFKNQNDFAAGWWLSLFYIKPHLIVVPLILLAYKRRFRALAPMLLIGIALAFISFVFFGSDTLKAYFALLSVHSGWHYNPEIRWRTMTTTWAGFVQLFFVSKNVELPLVAQSLWLFGAGISVLLLLMAWRDPWDTQSPQFNLQWGLLFSTTVFTTLHGYAYELVLLVPPFAVIFEELFNQRNASDAWLIRAIQSSLFIAPACVLLALLIGLPFLPVLLGIGNLLLARTIIQKAWGIETR